jgi:hypothetical protein
MLIAAPAVSRNSIEIDVVAERNEFRLGEPVVVYVSIKNTASNTAAIVPDIRPEVDNLRYYITDPEGNSTIFSPIYVVEPSKPKFLNNNESVRGVSRVFFASYGYVFEKSGEYALEVRYQNYHSPPLQINVLPPSNDAEREQAEMILGHPEVGLFLMLEGGDFLKAAIAQIKELEERFPHSILSTYFQYAVAKNFSVPARNFISKKPRGPDYEKAIEILKSIKDREISLYYRDKIFTTLVFCLDQTGQPNEAIKIKAEHKAMLEANQDFLPYFGIK